MRRVADELSFWLAPGFAGVTIEPDFDQVEALSEDVSSKWARVSSAAFLTDGEKREMLGVGE